MSISQTITDFVTLAIQAGGWMELDRLYLQNRVLAMVGEEALTEITPEPVTKSSLDLLDELIKQAKINQVVAENTAAIEILEAQLMDFLTPPPSVVNAFFAKHYEKDPMAATDYFYHLSKQNDYIKTRAIAKNIVYPVDSTYGQLEITINLSKPEKDPKQIQAASKVKVNDYPKCLLCMENEGYKGRSDYPARTNHRIIRMNLEGESWGFQYSPYAYFNEHAILLAQEHRPMRINQATFSRLLKIVEIFPHYFVGSNADLPIVGGSILTHDHYQAGRHTFPMEKAAIDYYFELADYPLINAGIVRWPMSVIRLQGPNADELVAAATMILEKWQTYSDESQFIRAVSDDGTLHHTITPIARRKGLLFELDLVLRDNNVSETHPEGIFHPHKELQHIKKENIGLIEVMGLAILPPRLNTELQEIAQYVLGQTTAVAPYHQVWADQLMAQYEFTPENVHELIQKEVGVVFEQVLVDAGVFKRTEVGQAAFKKFIAYLS